MSFLGKRKRFYKKPTKYNAKRFKKTSKKSKTFKKKTFRGKSSGPTQYGTGHWRSFGKGPSGRKTSRGLIKKLETLLAPNTVLNNDSYQIACTAGSQNSAIISSIYDLYDLFNFNGGQAGTVTSTLVGFNKVILKTYSTTINFTNQTNANAKVTFYDLVNRTDAMTNSVSSIQDPLTAWNVDNTGLSSGYDPTVYGATPFDSQLVTKNFKIIKVTEFRLAEGETGEYKIHSPMNKIFDFSKVFQGVGSGTKANLVKNQGGLKGLTTWTLAVVTGSPTDNNNTAVNTSLATIDFVTNQRYIWEAVQTQQATIKIDNNLGGAAGTVYNQGSGAAVTITAV